MAVNVYGVIVRREVAGTKMGRKIKACSITGKRPGRRATLYTGSKFAIRRHHAKVSRWSSAPDGITVKVVCPARDAGYIAGQRIDVDGGTVFD
jgi:short-subunit dehydrogenase